MFSPELVQLSVAVLAALSVGGVVYVFIMPFMSGERKATKRLQAVSDAKGRRARLAANADATQQSRRKQVQNTLNDLEAKKKKSKTVPLRTRLEQAGLTIEPKTFYIFSAISAIICAGASMLASTNLIVISLAAFVGAFGLPRKVISIMKSRRQKMFVEEFANALDVIVRGVKSGLPLGDCLNIIANESAEPVKSEFAELVHQQRIGVPIQTCLEKMHERTDIPEVGFFSIVIAIQQKAGGNLAEALGNLSQVLRDRKQLRNKVQAFSSEAKSSAAIIGSLPFLVTLLVYLTTPEYISLLWEDKLGNMMLVGSGFWMLCGVLIMRKMINFEY